MSRDMELLIYATLFIAVLLGVEGLFMLLGGDPSMRKAVNRRMRLRQTGRTQKEVMVKLRRTDALPDDDETEDAWFDPLRSLDRLLAQAGVGATAWQALLLMITGGAVLWAALTFVLRFNPLLALPVATVAGVGAPLLMLAFRRQRRIKRFAEQLPDGLDMVVRSLRAGHPVTAALRLFSEHMPDPIGSEMGLVVDEMTYGLDLRQAMQNLSRRVPAPEVGFMVVAINIQYQSGGNLAEVLSGLSSVIRQRMKMVRKIRAVSAEGRFSAYMISAMPFVVGGIINVINPDYFGEVVSDPMFMPGLLMLGVLLVVGIFSVFRIVNFKF